MATAMIEGFIASGQCEPGDITVCVRSEGPKTEKLRYAAPPAPGPRPPGPALPPGSSPGRRAIPAPTVAAGPWASRSSEGARRVARRRLRRGAGGGSCSSA